MLRKTCRLSVLLILLVGLNAGVASAQSIGHLSGLFLDQSGRPLVNVLISLLRAPSESGLPFLVRTNENGRIYLSGLEAGRYQLRVKSARYRSPASRTVEIMPGRTAVVTLILQQLFGFEGSSEENLGLKALLRASRQRRLIFRNVPELPGPFGDKETPLFEEAVFELYTNAGLGSDFFSFPTDSWGGMSTNFAVSQSLPGVPDYIFAGQLNSGQDSLWRVKSVVDYDLGSNHGLKIYMGYGRVGFQQPTLALLENPGRLDEAGEFTNSLGTAHLLTFGFEDSLQLSPAWSVKWGGEVNRLRSSESSMFVAPNVQLQFDPSEKTHFAVAVSSRRGTQGNTVTLPDGRQVDLSNSVYITRIGDSLTFSKTRHTEAVFSQWLTEGTAVEVAWFQSALSGGSLPLLAVFQSTRPDQVTWIDGDAARSRGYRMTLRQNFGDSFDAKVSYIRGTAPSLTDSAPRNLELEDGLTGLGRGVAHVLATQLDAVISSSSTRVTALVKIVAAGRPIMTIDYLSDVHETGNEGVNFFVRQLVPVPEGLLEFFGLDFLAPNRIEALFDVRNLFNNEMGSLQLADSNVSFFRNPRTVRGGISFKF